MKMEERVENLMEAVTEKEQTFDQFCRQCLAAGYELKEAMRIFKQSFVRQALIVAGGNQSHAAKSIDIHRNSLARVLDSKMRPSGVRHFAREILAEEVREIERDLERGLRPAEISRRHAVSLMAIETIARRITRRREA